MKSAIPNTVTVTNLLCGCLGIVAMFSGEVLVACYLMIASLILDFLDGFLARLLKVSGEFGKQIDSLADMVSFGVFPGIILYQLTSASLGVQNISLFHRELPDLILSCIPLMIPVFSAIRLAKFNIDCGPEGYFMGFPTPANAAFIGSLQLVLVLQFNLNFNSPLTAEIVATMSKLYYWDGFEIFVVNLITNSTFLLFIAVFNSLFLIAPIPLFSLKLKSLAWKVNKVRYVALAGICLLLTLTCLPYIFSSTLLPNIDYIVLPLIVVIYVVISIINNFVKK